MVMRYLQTEEAKGGYLQGDDVRGHVGQLSGVVARWSEIVVVEMVEKWRSDIGGRSGSSATARTRRGEVIEGG
jgi:hypothetical protein